MADYNKWLPLFLGANEEATKTNNFILSGAIALDQELSARLALGGNVVEVRGFQHIGDGAAEYVEPNYDETDNAPSNKFVQHVVKTAALDRNSTWREADLEAQLANASAIPGAIITLGQYMNQKRNKALNTILKTLFGTNGALVSTHLNDISVTTDTAPGATNKVSEDAIIDTLSVFEDRQGDNNVLVMHADIYRALQKADLITTTRMSEQNIMFRTFLGFPIVLDNAVTKEADTVYTGGTAYQYNTYVVGAGAIRMGNSAPGVPIEFHREPLQANGGGMEYLTLRDRFAFGVGGVSFTGSVAGKTVADSEIATAASWTKVFADKNIRVACIRTNG